MGNIQVTISEIPFATVVLVPWLFFAVSALFEDFPRLGLRQVAGLVAVVGWALGLILDRSEDHRYLVASEAVGLLLFCGMWVREFRLLMLRRDDEFPGRLDKPAWIFALTLLAPAGVWLHRSYRLARRPEPPDPERIALDSGDTPVGSGWPGSVLRPRNPPTSGPPEGTGGGVPTPATHGSSPDLQDR